METVAFRLYHALQPQDQAQVPAWLAFICRTPEPFLRLLAHFDQQHTREEVLAHMAQEQAADSTEAHNKRLNSLCYQLKQHLESFIAHRAMRDQRHADQRTLLILEYLQQSDAESSQGLLPTYSGRLSPSGEPRTANHYRRKYDYQMWHYASTPHKQGETPHTRLDQMVESLDLMWVHERLNLLLGRASRLWTVKTMQQELQHVQQAFDAERKHLQILLAHHQRHRAGFPYCDLVLSLIDAVEATRLHGRAFDLAHWLTRLQQIVSLSEDTDLGNLFNYLYNFIAGCKGLQRIESLALLYQWATEEGVFRSRGFQVDTHYCNLVTVFCATQQYQLARDYLVQLQPLLPKAQQEALYLFNLMTLHSAQEKWDALDKILLQFTPQQGAQEVIARTHRWTVDYEQLTTQDQSMALLQRLASDYDTIRNQRGLTAWFKAKHLKLCRLLIRLLKAQKVASLDKLLQEADKGDLAKAAWFMAKVRQKRGRLSG